MSIFEKLHALRPMDEVLMDEVLMDEVLMDLYTEEPALVAFLERLTDYWLRSTRPDERSSCTLSNSSSGNDEIE